jgi:hypothetical protein
MEVCCSLSEAVQHLSNTRCSMSVSVGAQAVALPLISSLVRGQLITLRAQSALHAAQVALCWQFSLLVYD